jgi:hypothetical protein
MGFRIHCTEQQQAIDLHDRVVARIIDRMNEITKNPCFQADDESATEYDALSDALDKVCASQRHVETLTNPLDNISFTARQLAEIIQSASRDADLARVLAHYASNFGVYPTEFLVACGREKFDSQTYGMLREDFVTGERVDAQEVR